MLDIAMSTFLAAVVEFKDLPFIVSEARNLRSFCIGERIRTTCICGLVVLVGRTVVLCSQEGRSVVCLEIRMSCIICGRQGV